MKQQMNESLQQVRLKKLLLVLPLLVLPFMTMAFWVLGGGRGNNGLTSFSQKGINTQLPEAQFKGEKPQDKMSLYDQARKDSASGSTHAALSSLDVQSAIKDSALKAQLALSGSRAADDNEAQISRKLALLRQEMNKAPEPQPMNAVTANYPTTSNQPANTSEDTERLEKLMKTMSSKNADDPEMKQLEGMVDKILQIQHPELVAAQLQQQQKPIADSLYKAFRAVIVDNQKAYQGSAIKLRLLDTIHIKGLIIPKGQMIFGSCQIVNQRLLLNIKTIRLGTSILPVDLTVYDMDSMPGINVPDAQLQDAVRSGSDNAMQNMQFLPVDQTMTTQLAGAGVEAAKGLFAKKVKRIKIKLTANYPVLLRNNQPNK
ncbi:conjugative transposon protein TraM [Mucilaginibacter sp.]